MEELIPINQETNTVNARDLWEFLEVKTRFNDWIERRIEDYKFAENTDYTVFIISGGNPLFIISGGNPHGGRPSKEYHISIHMAKKLAMVEKTQKGNDARDYLIACKVMTTSLEVERVFRKKHQHVLEKIEKIRNTKELEEFGLSNFRLISYFDEQKQPMYEMTRDGWSFLVMGFTKNMFSRSPESNFKKGGTVYPLSG